MDKARHREGYKWYRVDRETMSMKLAFFAEGWRRGAHWPFMIVFFITLGLTKTQAGFVNGFRLIGSLISGPFWTMLADKTKKHQLIIFIQNTGGMFFMCMHVLIDIYLKGTSTHNNGFNETERYSQNSTDIGNVWLTESEVEHAATNIPLFWILFFLNITVTFFDGNLEGFLDAAAMRKFDSLPYRCDYGFQRIFATVGFVFGFFISDILIKPLENVEGVSKYTGMIISYSLSLITLEISAYLLNKDLQFDDRSLVTTSQTSKTKFLKLVLNTCLQPRILFFVFTIAVHGIISSFYFYFSVLFLEGMNASSFFHILYFALDMFFMFVGFLIGSKMVRYCRGVWNVIILSLFACSLRYVVYSLTENLWFILSTQCLEGFCFSIFVCACVHHIKDFCPDEILTTMYGIRTTTHFSVGFIVGNAIGGYIYDKFGGHVLYGGGAALAFIWAVCVTIFACLCSKSKKIAVSDEDLPLLKRKTIR